MRTLAFIISALSIALSLHATAGDEENTPPIVGHVDKAVFSSGISNRQPVDDIVTLKNSRNVIYYYTELSNLKGRKISHAWYYQGKETSKVTFVVGASQQSVYSKKTLDRRHTGKWMVIVVDESGWALKASVFQYLATQKSTKPSTAQ
ncbi:MAG: DUF2914 domain-containing protein [Gammaproteobacteria bacterium]|nr:DUF2914 domain-containing protein [Gammaproteobacteria bacterium]